MTALATFLVFLAVLWTGSQIAKLGGELEANRKVLLRIGQVLDRGSAERDD
jgi:hypothetical protein